MLSGTIALFGGTGQTTGIANNDTTPIAADSTDFGHYAFSSGHVTRTFKMSNTGADPLNLVDSKIQVAGDDAADFTINVAPADTVAAGGSTTFTLWFDPSAAGLRHATVVLSSDDPTTPTFSFDIQGTGLTTTDNANGLQIATTVAGTGTTVVAGDNLLVNYTGYLLDGTVFDSSLKPGADPFAITGIGTASLIAGWNQGLIGMTVGEHRTLIIPPALGYGADGQGNIPGNATLIFDIELLSDNSPVKMYGGAALDQVILDTQAPTALADFTNFGSVQVGATTTRTFAVGNIGADPLTLLGTLPGGPLVVISGANASEFTVTAQPTSATVAPGTTGTPTKASFTIQFKPTAPGLHTAVVTVLTDSPNEGSYSFTIQGLAHTVTKAGTGAAVVVGDNVLFHYTERLQNGTVIDSSVNSVPVTVENIGNANLIAGLNLGLIGMKVGESRTLTLPPEVAYGATGQGSIPPNATLIFDIELLSTNSPLQVRGGTNFSEIIVDGQVTTAAAAHSDFGNVVVAKGYATWKFAVVNFGTTGVGFLGGKHVVISGLNKSDFKVVTDLTPSVAAKDAGTGNAGVSTFEIKFDPTKLGVRTAVVTIVTDNPDEGAIRFTVTGTGTYSNLTLAGAKEDTPLPITFATLYQNVFGVKAPKTAMPFLIQSIQSGTLVSANGQAVTPGTTTFGPGQTFTWTPAVNANHTLAAFTVAQWNGTAVVGSPYAMKAEVLSVLEAPNGTIADITLRQSDQLRTPTIDLSTLLTEADLTGKLIEFDTTMGNFWVNTFTNVTASVDKFMSYVTANLLDKTIVQNVTPRSLVRSGAYALDAANTLNFVDANGAISGIAPEIGNSNVRGTVALDRSMWAWNCNTSRFAFNLANNTDRDPGYTVFGEVVRGMNVVDAIGKVPPIDLTKAPYNWNPDFKAAPINAGNLIQITDIKELTPSVTYALVSGGVLGGVTASLAGSVITFNIPAGVTGGATFTVTATGASGLVATRTFSVNVPVVTVTASDAVAGETSAGVRPNPGTFLVSRTGPTTSPLTVAYTVGGAATPGVNYEALSGTVTIPSGASSAAVNVLPIEDGLVEGNQNVTVTLIDGVNYSLGAQTTAAVNILDNGKPFVSVAASTPGASEPNTPGAFTFSRTGSTANPLTVVFTRAGTAKAGTDYVNFATTVAFPAGAATVDVVVQPLADALVEPPESVIVTVAASAAYSPAALPADRTAQVTITDGVISPTVDVQLLSMTYTGRTYSRFNLAGQTLTISGQVRNQGLSITAGWVQINFFLSLDRVLDGGDIALSGVNLSELAGQTTAPFSHTVDLDSITVPAVGQYFVIAQVVGGAGVLASPLNNIIVTP
ncbi:MAG: FKBP-type peptidyl-prolyl cis-trans isomerase [Phycisphaerae bacterium]|nr:FKBP-type peptidyl-prolyl cis-trans isomerase [Phycisphaerae bacterium]